MKKLRSMKSQLAGSIVAVILLVNIFPLVVYGASGPWEGHSWEGDSWEGDSWKGETWEGHSWNNYSWESLPWDGNPWDYNVNSGHYWNGNPWNNSTTGGTPWGGNADSGSYWNGSPWNRNSNHGPWDGRYGEFPIGSNAPWNQTLWNQKGWRGPMMNPGNDQGNYDSGNSGFGNYGPEGYAGNGYDANNGESETPYFDDFKRARRWYNWGVSTGIGAMSAKLGFRITQRGNKNIITGPRDVKGRWQKSWTGKKLSRWNNGFSNKVGNTLEKVYDDHRGFKGTHTWFGKSTKNVVQKHMKMGAAAKSGLKGTFGKGALKISTNLKGSGLVGAFATFGLDLWKYNPWSGGVKSDVGYANTDFASAVITDAGIAAGTTIVSSAAGAGAAAMAGAMYGSVIPGLGTAVGAAVGLGIGIFMTTDLGRNIRKWVKGGVKSVLDKGVEAAKDAWKKTKDIANKVGDTVQGAWDWATGLF